MEREYKFEKLVVNYFCETQIHAGSKCLSTVLSKTCVIVCMSLLEDAVFQGGVFMELLPK